MKTDQNSNMQGTLNKRISMKKRRNAKRALLALNLVAVIFTTTVFSNPVSVLSEEVSTDTVQSIENSPGTDAQIAEQADVQQNTAEAAQAVEAPAAEAPAAENSAEAAKAEEPSGVNAPAENAMSAEMNAAEDGVVSTDDGASSASAVQSADTSSASNGSFEDAGAGNTDGTKDGIIENDAEGLNEAEGTAANEESEDAASQEQLTYEDEHVKISVSYTDGRAFTADSILTRTYLDSDEKNAVLSAVNAQISKDNSANTVSDPAENAESSDSAAVASTTTTTVEYSAAGLHALMLAAKNKNGSDATTEGDITFSSEFKNGLNDAGYATREENTENNEAAEDGSLTTTTTRCETSWKIYAVTEKDVTDLTDAHDTHFEIDKNGALKSASFQGELPQTVAFVQIMKKTVTETTIQRETEKVTEKETQKATDKQTEKIEEIETEKATEKTTETEKETEDVKEEVPASAAMPAVTFDQKVTTDNGTVMVHVEAEEGAFEEGTSMTVTPVTSQTILDKAIDAAGGKGAAVAMDITFTKPDGTKTEPLKPIHVKMISAVLNRADEAHVVHVADSGSTDVVAKKSDGKTIESTSSEAASSDAKNAVSFESDSFSVYAIVYTVDFEYSVNGKMYQFSLPGGGYVSFTDLVEVLGITDDTDSGNNGAENETETADNAEENTANKGSEEISIVPDTETALTLGDVKISEDTRKFVANVESVEFSSPELVDVSKVYEDTTVGQLKESRGLECEYSAELTEEQIAEINSQMVEAGDWALISLHPFTSEETLTVTMKNGDQFAVKVTDAQISTHVITADGGDYTITVTYGPEAGIPDGAELTASELLPGTEEYEAHYTQMIAAVESEASDSDPDDEMDAAFAELSLEVVDPQPTVEVAFARFFDISIWKDDTEIEPLAPVQVEIQYNEPVSADSGAEAEVVHFAEDGIELIDPNTDLRESSGEGISSFTYQQSSFSISATLLKYTTGIQNGNYLIIKGAKVNGQDHYYALKADGSTVEVTKNGDTFTNTSNNADDAFWTFTNAGNGQYYIQNRSNRMNRLVLYNNIVGNWDQKINVEAPGGRKTVYLRNPNNTPLRFNGNTQKFVLGAQNDNADQVYLARLNSEIPQGRGYNLTPAAETDLGDLNAWKDKVENSKIIVDKTASVVDYDNRIYQIDLKALSDITIIANKVDLELIVDTSRSMYFPANLSAMSDYYFTSIMGNDSHSLERQLASLNKNQIYYFIGNGEQATVYALYYAASGTNLNDHTGDECWKFVDASYMNPPDAGAMNQSDRLNRLVGMRIDDLAYSICNQTREGGGCRLYTASSSITRLAYLKEAVRIASEIVYAVNKDNRIGLVTFNSSAKDQGFFNYSNRNSLYNKINTISLAGGTRQDLGLKEGKSQLDSNGRADAQKIAILITDGAPNMKDSDNKQIPSDTAWSMISQEAGALKGTNSSNAKLYTLGLSLDMVGGNNQRNLDGLASEEDGVTRHFNASNGPDIVRAVKDLIDTLMYDVTLEAEVTDVLDPAFYPVDQNGNPIAAGDYKDENDKRYNWSVVTVDGAQCWKITYYDQEVGRGEKNADNTIKTPGWQKSFYVKAKEDFLGGNEIETNRYKSSNNRVKPTKYVYKERGTNATKKVDPPSNAPWGKFENTPTVNVDELHLTEHSTEWTVYMGIEVKPEDQVKALWDEIKVKQVVKTNGTANNGTTITKGDKKWYSKTDTKDTAAPDKEYSSLPINRYFTDVDFNTLLNQLKTQDSAEKTINYTAYGHQPGTITVKLEKKIIDGAVDANVKAPGQHITDKDGTPAEKYTITVTYTPNKTDTGCNIGHVTTGTGQDEVKSANEHKINVFVKKLKLLKADQGGNTISSDSATFVLYRKATSDEIADESVAKTDLTGLSGKYVTVQTLTTNGGSVITGALPLLADNEPYYLVETKAPAGYIMLTEPLKVTVDMTDHNTWTKLADNSTSQTKPDPYVLSNWLQETTIKLLKLNDTAYDPTQTSTYNHSNDTTEASVTYKIINNAGYELPSTGGPGTWLFTILGSILFLGASVLLWRRRRSI